MDQQKTGYANDSWFFFPKPNQNAKLRMFCFPYAGSGASIYKKWESAMPLEVELCAVQLPGRENRITEAAFKDFSSLINVLAEKILPLLDKPYIFFGHSMGALISFELARKLREASGELPIHLLLSGINPLKSTSKLNINTMDDDEFINFLNRLNGTPTEILKNKEVLSFFLPVIKADFELLNSYSFAHKPPLECPITSYGGMDDTPEDNLKGWIKHTDKTLEVKMFPGDHFFINSSRQEVLAALRTDLIMIVNKIAELDEMEFLENFINNKKDRSIKKGAIRGEKQRELAENIKKNWGVFK